MSNVHIVVSGTGRSEEVTEEQWTLYSGVIKAYVDGADVEWAGEYGNFDTRRGGVPQWACGYTYRVMPPIVQDRLPRNFDGATFETNCVVTAGDCVEFDLYSHGGNDAMSISLSTSLVDAAVILDARRIQELQNFLNKNLPISE